MWNCVAGLYYAESENQVEKLLEKQFGEDWEEDYIIHRKKLETI